jgi:WD40 repeat protein
VSLPLFAQLQTNNDVCRHFVAVSSDCLTFAVAGLNGSIHIYGWESGRSPLEKVAVTYNRTYIIPRSITLSFFHGSRFLLVGGEAEHATIFDLTNDLNVSHLSHQSKFHLIPFRIIFSFSHRRLLCTISGSMLFITASYWKADI